MWPFKKKRTNRNLGEFKTYYTHQFVKKWCNDYNSYCFTLLLQTNPDRLITFLKVYYEYLSEDLLHTRSEFAKSLYIKKNRQMAMVALRLWRKTAKEELRKNALVV